MRRSISVLFAICWILACTMPVAAAQEATPASATPVPDVDIAVLFVQTATSSTLAPLVSDGGKDGATHVLVLSGGMGQTIYFADRPNREVGTVETTVLIDAFRTETGDPPNAALVGQTAEGVEEIVVVELLRGDIPGIVVDLTPEQLLTDYSEVDLVLENEPVGEVAEARRYEASTLFIDDWCYGKPTDGNDSSASGGWVGGRGGCSSS